VVVSVLLVLLGGVWLAVRGAVAARLVQSAQAELAFARTAFEAEDLPEGADRLARARGDLAQARRATSDPVWRVAGTAPVLGDDVAAVRAVVASAAGLLEAAEPVAAAAARAAATPGDGPAAEPSAVLAALLRDPAVAAGLSLTRDRAAAAEVLVTGLAAQELHPLLAAQVQAYGDAVTQLDAPLHDATALTGLAPMLLGIGEPTDLLVVVQTPAEVRSLGGLAGLVLVVRAQDGRLEVVETYSGSTVPALDEPVLSTPELEEHYALLGDRAGRFLVNATMVPDGALASQLLVAAHVRRGGMAPDAVVLTDLSVLTRLLDVTGPVTLADGTVLDAGSSDALLQHGVYVTEPDPLAQDAFFAATAVAVVTALSAPTIDAVGLGRALVAEAGDGKLLLYSPDADTQQLVLDLGMAGDLLSDPTSVGVFLNDGVGSKMQYFLDAEVSVAQGEGGRGLLRLDLRSTAVPGAPLPDYVAGRVAELGLERGGQRVQVLVEGPVGDGPSRWTVDGVPVLVGSGVIGGRGAGVLSVDLAPGQQVRVEVELSDGRGLHVDQLVTTPSVSVLPPSG